jgi:quinol monooxygenase YgiN
MTAQTKPQAPGAGGDGPVAYVITFALKPGRAADFLALLAPVLDAMRHEAGFISAVLHRDPENADRFMLYETWADHDDVMNVQVHRDYRQAYWAALPGLLARPREAQIWRPLRGDTRALSVGGGTARDAA